MSDNLEDLLRRVRTAGGPDRGSDAELCIALQYGGENSAGAANVRTDDDWDGDLLFEMDGEDCCNPIPHVTGSIDTAVALIEHALPHWWWTCGLCALTGHASIGPDYNGPDRERLFTEWPPEIYDHGQFNADLPPGDGIHRVCYALLDCMLQALIAKAAGIPVREG